MAKKKGGKKGKAGGKGGGNKRKGNSKKLQKEEQIAESTEETNVVAAEETNATTEPTDMYEPKSQGEDSAKEPQSKPEEKEEASSPPEEESPTPTTTSSTEEKKSEDGEKETAIPEIPRNLEASLSLFTERQKELARALCSRDANQGHLFERWPTPSRHLSPSSEASNNVKRRLMAQLERLDDAYADGGLLGYIRNAKKLLAASQAGVNPLDGWTPSVSPKGENFELGTEAFDETEKLGLDEVGKCGFVLTAGGLGERLGYGDIKIGLPTEMATGTSYIQYYIEIILAYQSRYAAPGTKLPLCIMVSKDTDAKTVALLEKHDRFGMAEDQITLVRQGDGVPALDNNDARLVLDAVDRYNVSTKPHGHGDIHALLHSEQVAKKWVEMGIKWAVFFQDTNGLAFHSVPLALGVSSKLGLVMNSVAVPRKAKQAIGGIALLKNEEGEEKTINVEYNQLDPMLSASGEFPDGDANDDSTGYSPFPGNINQLVFELESYVQTLDATKGIMPEFVNPKYKDPEKTIFQKPTRLECMMQDFPTVLSPALASRVGFTCLPAELCFSPVKNASADGARLQQQLGVAPGAAASGEADQYTALRLFLRAVGARVEDAPAQPYLGIQITPGPRVVFRPDFCVCTSEVRAKFPQPGRVKISPNSSLVIRGADVTVESLDLDGALEVDCEDGAPPGVIRDLIVRNQGWRNEPLEDNEDEDEILKMRGYRLHKIETHRIIFRKDGTMDEMTETTQNGPDTTLAKPEEPDTAPAEPEEPVTTPAKSEEPNTKPEEVAQAPPAKLNEPEKPAKVVTTPNPVNSRPTTTTAPPTESREMVDLSQPAEKTKQKDCSCTVM